MYAQYCFRRTTEQHATGHQHSTTATQSPKHVTRFQHHRTARHVSTAVMGGGMQCINKAQDSTHELLLRSYRTGTAVGWM